MKKPLINEYDRLVMRTLPKDGHTQRLEAGLAIARLKKELGKQIKPISEWLNNKLRSI